MTNKYANYGNEKLVPLATAGNQLALEELEDRGNYIDPKYPGEACKDTLAGKVLNDAQITAMGITPQTTVVVVNGKVKLKT